MPEHKLWSRLRDRRLEGLKFRRQVPIGPFIADYFCVESRLVVEIDGDSHGTTAQKDMERTAFLSEMGIRVMRFTNRELSSNLEGVLQAIRDACLGSDTAGSQ